MNRARPVAPNQEPGLARGRGLKTYKTKVKLQISGEHCRSVLKYPNRWENLHVCCGILT